MENINQAFSEVYDIMNHFEKKIYNRIPARFIEMIKDNKDNTYQPQIDYNISINKQKLLKETRIILSLIYRDYICSDEKKEELKYNDMIEIKEYQEKIYNPDNLFKKKAIKKEQCEKDEKMLMVVENANIFKRIINKIKNYFFRKL